MHKCRNTGIGDAPPSWHHKPKKGGDLVLNGISTPIIVIYEKYILHQGTNPGSREEDRGQKEQMNLRREERKTMKNNGPCSSSDSRPFQPLTKSL